MTQAADDFVPIPIPDGAEIPVLYARQSLILAFIEAIAKTHPDPMRLHSMLQSILDDNAKDQIPYDDLTPENQIAQQHFDFWRDILLRAIGKQFGKL